MYAAAGRLAVMLGVAVCLLARCGAAPAMTSSLDDVRSLTSRDDDVRPNDVRRQTAICAVVHFPPPNQHIYCCRLVDDCQCPRRMGICAPDSVAASASSAAWSSLLKRILAM